jgi:hypothetical protein
MRRSTHLEILRFAQDDGGWELRFRMTYGHRSVLRVAHVAQHRVELEAFLNEP